MVAVNAMIPTEHELLVYHNMAEQAVTSKMYKGDKAGVMAIMLSARELGIPPMAALNGGLNIIQGKVEISARMMSALIRKAGHSIQEKVCTEEECILVGQRGDNKDTLTASYTIEDAKKAGLIKEGGGWKKFPKDMVFARALSRLARRLFADVIGTGYVEGEIREAVFEVVEQIPEDPRVDVELLLRDFLSQFDKEEALGWVEYITQLREKLKLSVSVIVDKYNADPIAAKEKYNSWKTKQEGKA